MPSKSKSSKRHPSSDPPEPKSHPNPTSSNPIQDPPAPPPGKNPNPRSSKPPKPSSPTPALPKSTSKSSDPMMPDDPSAASPSRKSDRKRKARDFDDDLPPAAKSPQAGQRRLADDNAVALLRAAIDFRSRTGSIPLPSNMFAFYDSVEASLPTPLTKEQVYNKLRHLRQKFHKTAPPGSGPNDVLVHELCVGLWGAEDDKDVNKDQKKTQKGTLVAAVENGDAADEEEEDKEPEEEGDGEERVGGGPDSLPYVRSAAAEHWNANGLWGVSWEVGLKRMDSSKARALEEKWRRQLGDEMRLQMDWCKTSREILALLNDAYKVEEHGREHGEVEFYRLTHTHRDDNFVREESREIVDRARSLIAERVGDSASSEVSRVEAQVFTELMGPEHYGRMRGYGVGVTPAQMSAVSRYSQDTRGSSSFADVRREIEDIKQSHQTEMEEMRRSHQTEIQSLRAQLDQITSVLHRFIPPQVPDTSSSRRDDDDAADH